LDAAEEVQAPPRKNLSLANAAGQAMCGSWVKGGKQLALVLRATERLELTPTDLHPKGYEWSMAHAACGDLVVGSALPKAKKGQEAITRAIVWNPDGSIVELPAGGENEGYAMAVEGKLVAGWAGFVSSRRAALWSADGESVLDLTPPDASAEVCAMSQGVQVGKFFPASDEHFFARAALWRGTAESFVDLTPQGFDSACALGCAGGFQVGFAVKGILPRGSLSSLSEAMLWMGNTDEKVNLHQLLPPEWNASEAVGIVLTDNLVRVVGTARTYSIQHPGQDSELHTLDQSAAVVWQSRT
jgi:hypothetical protein